MQDALAGMLRPEAIKGYLKVVRRTAAGARQLARFCVVRKHFRRRKGAVIARFPAEGNVHRDDGDAVFLCDFGRDIGTGLSGQKDRFHGQTHLFYSFLISLSVRHCRIAGEMLQKCESDKKAGILPVSSVYSAIRFRRTMNSEPSPGALRTAMLPPEISSTRLTSARPRPFPSREWDESPW